MDTYSRTEINSLINSGYGNLMIDNMLLLKANQSTTYTKTENDVQLLLKANQSTTYTKTESDATYYTKSAMDALLLLEANQTTTYTKTENDAQLLLKANQLTTYTKTERFSKLKIKTKCLSCKRQLIFHHNNFCQHYLYKV